MATWPSSLPQPQVSGYALSAMDATIRTDMDGGAARVRRRSTAVPDQVELSFVLDEAQMATFRAFWDTDMLGGAAWVYIPIKDGRSPGVSSKECRPVDGQFKASPVSRSHWGLSFKAEVRNA